MKRYVAAFYRRKWIYLFVLIAMLGATGAAAVQTSTAYESSSHLWVDRPTIDRLLGREPQDYQTGMEERTPAGDYSSMLGSLIQTDSFILSVIEGTELENELGGTVSTQREVIENVRNNIEHAAIGRNTIEISYLGDDPDVSQQVVNGVLEQFQSWNVELQSDGTSIEQEYYQERIETFEAQVVAAQERLEEYRTENPSPEPNSAEAIETERLQRELETARGQLYEALQQATEAEILDSLAAEYAASEFRVLDEATAPQTPSLVQSQLLTVLVPGIIASFGLVFLALVLVVWQDRAVRSPDDLRAVTSAPVLASIPRFRRKRQYTGWIPRRERQQRFAGRASD